MVKWMTFYPLDIGADAMVSVAANAGHDLKNDLFSPHNAWMSICLNIFINFFCIAFKESITIIARNRKNTVLSVN